MPTHHRLKTDLTDGGLKEGNMDNRQQIKSLPSFFTLTPFSFSFFHHTNPTLKKVVLFRIEWVADSFSIYHTEATSMLGDTHPSLDGKRGGAIVFFEIKEV